MKPGFDSKKLTNSIDRILEEKQVMGRHVTESINYQITIKSQCLYLKGKSAFGRILKLH